MERSIAFFAIGIAVLIGALGTQHLLQQQEEPRAWAVTGEMDIGGAFALVDHAGRPATNKKFGDKLLLMLFGYTYCPDVCPVALQKIAVAMDLLGEDAEHVQPLFVTVDPRRDSPRVLAQYVGLFHPRLVGLTGTPEQVRRAAETYHVYYARVEADDGGYAMDHSAIIYLVEPGGRVLARFPHETSSRGMAETIRPYISNETS